MKYLFLVSVMLLHCFVFAQNYTSYYTGNPNINVIPKGGTCLMGGATEQDNAMRWFLEQANGGDILVLRASGSNGYNDYLFAQLGVNVNSVETIVCLNENSGDDPYIMDKINKAEGIWFAGGNQWNYINFWRNTNVNLALSQAVNRKCVFGGTSAGMAILGEHYFTAENGTISSDEALNNPFHFNATVTNTSFLQLPYLNNVITDTHYDNPDRRGRHVSFIARQSLELQSPIYGIACEEYVAICIDTLGVAHIYGEYPAYDEQAYFIAVNCEIPSNFPEICQANTPLTWNQNSRAVKVYKANGTINGTSTFDLNTWMNGTGGMWLNWWVEGGVLFESEDFGPNCINDLESSGEELWRIKNPVQVNEWIPILSTISKLRVVDSFGKEIDYEVNHDSIRLNTQQEGIYFLFGNNDCRKILLTR